MAVQPCAVTTLYTFYFQIDSAVVRMSSTSQLTFVKMDELKKRIC